MDSIKKAAKKFFTWIINLLRPRYEVIVSVEKFKGEYTEDVFTPNLEDMVNNPPHYNQHGIECLDAIN